MTSLTIDVPAALLINANDREHWATKARKTAGVRTMARFATGIRPALFGLVTLTVTITYPPRSRRRDASNLAPTVKALLDGIVDAGLLPDDNDKVVRATTYQASTQPGTTGMWRFQLDFTEVTA